MTDTAADRVDAAGAITHDDLLVAEGTTPSQTVGPFLAIGLPWADGSDAVADGTPGNVLVHGLMTDGAGAPVPDGLVEVWGAAPDGHFAAPGAAGPAAAFRGFARVATDAEGRFWFRTLKPAPLPAEDGLTQAPHLDLLIFARGLLRHLVTRLYFPDEPQANAADPVLLTLDDDERRALTAVADHDGRLRFDIRLQGDGETPFFDV